MNHYHSSDSFYQSLVFAYRLVLLPILIALFYHLSRVIF